MLNHLLRSNPDGANLNAPYHLRLDRHGNLQFQSPVFNPVISKLDLNAVNNKLNLDSPSIPVQQLKFSYPDFSSTDWIHPADQRQYFFQQSDYSLIPQFHQVELQKKKSPLLVYNTHTQTIIFANASCLRLLGFTIAQLKTIRVADLISLIDNSDRQVSVEGKLRHRRSNSNPVAKNTGKQRAAVQNYFTEGISELHTVMHFCQSRRNITVSNVQKKSELNKEFLKTTSTIFARTFIDEQELEKAEISKQLHEEISQILSAAKFYLEEAEAGDIDRNSILLESSRKISLAIDAIKCLSTSLTPLGINDVGLVNSISDMLDRFMASNTIQVNFLYNREVEYEIDYRKKLMLYRIVQLVMSNHVKFYRADAYEIKLSCDAENIYLTFMANGKSFDCDNLKDSETTVLKNIIARVGLYHGKVKLTNDDGQGSTLAIEIPIVQI